MNNSTETFNLNAYLNEFQSFMKITPTFLLSVFKPVCLDLVFLPFVNNRKETIEQLSPLL